MKPLIQNTSALWMFFMKNGKIPLLPIEKHVEALGTVADKLETMIKLLKLINSINPLYSHILLEYFITSMSEWNVIAPIACDQINWSTININFGTKLVFA